MKIIDFTYFRIARFLNGRLKNWKNASIALITVIQISIITYPIITIYSFNENDKNIANTLTNYGIIFCIVLYLFNIIRYSKMGQYDKLSFQYELLAIGLRRFHGIITVIMVVLSFFYAPIALALAGAKLQ